MIHQLDLSEAELHRYAADPSEATQAKELPDESMMIMRDIWAALDGEDYYYYPVGTDGQGIKVSGCPPAVWHYYLELFIRCEEFGLPKGRGWQNEPSWLLDFLIHMRQKKSKVESWMIRKQTDNKGNISGPADFGGGN